MPEGQRLIKNPPEPGSSFTFRVSECAYFYDRYHYHPEYEITFIKRGSGIRFAGDGIGRFSAGEVVLLGPNLAHMWKCDRKYYDNPDAKACCSYALHFPADLFPATFLELPEMKGITNVLEESKRGIKAESETARRLADLFHSMEEAGQNRRFMLLFQMLTEMGRPDGGKILSGSYVSEDYTGSSAKLNEVYNYLLSHFREKVSLEEIAEIARMNPNAFCRFFKEQTGKSLTDFINELRINYASRLLLTEKQSKVAQVAMESGFTNISHFNKQFKKFTGKTPKQFLHQPYWYS